MNINSVGSGASNINLGVISRPVAQNEDGDNDHDNGRRAHGRPDSFRSDFRSLMQAVQSGDMTSAQSALASIKNDVGSTNATYSPTPDTTSASSPASTIGSDLKTLFDAVGTGDATSAQAALAQFVTDRQAAWQQAKTDASSSPDQQPSQQVGGHHHHGHRHNGLESVIASLFGSASSSASTPPTDSSATSDSTTPDSSATEATTAA